MKFSLTYLLVLCLFTQASAQNTDSIYFFMNTSLPELEFGKSNWGIFYRDTPYPIDSSICDRILVADWEKADTVIREEFRRKCRAMDMTRQKQFKWEQSRFQKRIIVTDVRDPIPLSVVNGLHLEKKELSRATYWIKEWNKSKADERLINYSSIPIFSEDKNYVLIVRGQDAEREGGWDTIYIYKQGTAGWAIWKEIVLTTL